VDREGDRQTGRVAGRGRRPGREEEDLVADHQLELVEAGRAGDERRRGRVGPLQPDARAAELPPAEQAQALFDRLSDDPPVELYVPDRFYVECGNTLWKRTRFFDYPEAEARRPVR